MKCIYKENPGSPYKDVFVEGRCRVFLIWGAGETLTAVDNTSPQVKFYNTVNGAATGTDLRLQLTDTANYAGTFYGSHWCVDLPQNGILFDDGLWVEFPAAGFGISVLVSGGKEA